MFLASPHKQLYVSCGSRRIGSYSTFCYLRFQSVNLALICTPCGQVWHPGYLTDLGNCLRPAVRRRSISVSILSVVPRSVDFVVDIIGTLLYLIFYLLLLYVESKGKRLKPYLLQCHLGKRFPNHGFELRKHGFMF